MTTPTPPAPDDANERFLDRTDPFDSEEAILAEVLEGDESGPVSRGDLRQIVTYMSHHRGPLPDPNTLARYNELIPDGAERVMRMAELEQGHRHRWERDQQDIVRGVATDESRIAGRGQLAAATLCVLLITAGVIFMLNGYAKLGATIILGDMVALATVFIKGSARPGTRGTDSEMPSLEDDVDHAEATGAPPELPETER